jgi:hypothetical protein
MASIKILKLDKIAYLACWYNGTGIKVELLTSSGAHWVHRLKG